MLTLFILMHGYIGRHIYLVYAAVDDVIHLTLAALLTPDGDIYFQFCVTDAKRTLVSRTVHNVAAWHSVLSSPSLFPIEIHSLGFIRTYFHWPHLSLVT
jgi:hypothetical protein